MFGFVPLAISIFGLSSNMVLAVVAFGAMWPVLLLATVYGLASVHVRLREVADALQLTVDRTRELLAERTARECDH